MECKEASETGKISEMYKLLHKIGMKGVKARRNERITKENLEEFKYHFENVSKDRYEVEPETIDEVVS